METQINWEPSQYLERVLDFQRWFDLRLGRAARSYTRLSTLALIFSASVPVASATTAPRWVLAALGGLVVVIEGYLKLTGDRDKSIAYRIASQNIGRELSLYRTRSGDYEGNDAFKRFVEKIEQILADAQNRITAISSQDRPTK
jgi:hypothetical protein